MPGIFGLLFSGALDALGGRAFRGLLGRLGFNHFFWGAVFEIWSLPGAALRLEEAA